MVIAEMGRPSGCWRAGRQRRFAGLDPLGRDGVGRETTLRARLDDTLLLAPRLEPGLSRLAAGTAAHDWEGGRVSTAGK
jgi:hypothetical protein